LNAGEELEAVLLAARKLLALPESDFSWSSWQDASAALAELDKMLAALSGFGVLDDTTMQALFAPTGDIQEVSISSGWGNEFLRLAKQFDGAHRRFVSSESRLHR
jgi:hypothetical protein